MSLPNGLLDGFESQLFGSGVDLEALTAGYGPASGIVCGSNPPYAISDFIGIYPKFQGRVPNVALQMYITLASASLMLARWQELWSMAMGLYVAHLATMYMRSEADLTPESPAKKIAVSGLERGIKISQSAADLSESSQLLEGMEQWGALAETTYGVQLITMAKISCAGAIWVG
jgi:hypothetical protein